MSKRKAPVLVVRAPDAFPDFSKFDSAGSKQRKIDRNPTTNKTSRLQIDFDMAVKEIHQLGSTQFTGKLKKQHEADQFRALVGREKQKEKVPVKIVRGIKKAAAKREAKQLQEVKESGLVTAGTGKKKLKRKFSEQNRRDTRLHGPAPSAGFMSKGILRVSKK
jgi:hypothetical protein